MSNAGAATQVKQQQQVWGKHRGLVVDNDDPERRGRVKLQVPGVLGSETSHWALPCFPFGGSTDSGLFVVPEVGATVWVEFEGGAIDQPIWVGSFYDRDPGGQLGDWRTRVLRTVGGQALRLDDTGGSTAITLTHHTGAQIELDHDGRVVLRDRSGNEVTLDAKASEIRVKDQHGNNVTTSSSGILAKDAQGDSVRLSTGQVVIKATTVQVDAQVVNLGGGGEPVLKGTSFLSAYAVHTHPTISVGAPTGPPVPTTEQQALSTKVKTG